MGLQGASDRRIWAACIERGAVLITKDADFVALAKQPVSKTQVVWIRLGNVTRRALCSALQPILPDILSALESGEPVVEVT